MGNPLPHLTEDTFATRLRAALPQSILDSPSFRRGTEHLLWHHYEEMRRWNPKLSLIGPGTATDAVERHYAESLQALLLLDSVEASSDEERLSVLDVGTGGGFPGLALAVAQPRLDMVLVEPNQRKCAFLEAALRRMARAAERYGMATETPWSCRVLGARVDGPLGHREEDSRSASQGASGWPERVDLVTSRALAWSPAIHQTLQDRWPAARFLLWTGRERPDLPSGSSTTRRVSLDPYGEIVEVVTD